MTTNNTNLQRIHSWLENTRAHERTKAVIKIIPSFANVLYKDQRQEWSQQLKIFMSQVEELDPALV